MGLGIGILDFVPRDKNTSVLESFEQSIPRRPFYLVHHNYCWHVTAQKQVKLNWVRVLW